MKLSLFKTEFPIMLAPMAGFTDMTYRSICREHGCDFTFTEMISAKGLKYGGKSADLMETAPNERPCGIQLFGRDPDIMAEMARRICGENKGELALIDINMGCPAPKITGNGEGSALMKEPGVAAKVIEAVVKASDLPVSVKFRIGVSKGPFSFAKENGPFVPLPCAAQGNKVQRCRAVICYPWRFLKVK